MKKDLQRISGINVLNCNDNKATIEVIDEAKLNILDSKGYKFHREEQNIFLVINPRT